jgi:hypothetical protein
MDKFDELIEMVEESRGMFDDNPEWRDEIYRDLDKCILIMENWC